MRIRLLTAVPAAAIVLFAGFWGPPSSPTSYDSTRWIDAALEHERAGDFAAAERDLLEAAKIDRLFQPRWTLAGFYFRRNDPEQFWLWTRNALAVGQRDLGALFDLCWKIAPDAPETIWGRAMPDRKATWDEYLFYLMTTGKWLAAGSLAARIAAVADSNDKTILLNYCDLALLNGKRSGAITVWRAMCRRGLLPYAADSLLTNGDFRVAPAGRGFDWRTPRSNGIVSSFHAGEAVFSLDGFEPEHAVLLEEPLALGQSERYRLEFEYRTNGIDSGSGIRWEAGHSVSKGFAASEWTRGGFQFTGAAASLVLSYRRPERGAPAEGTVSLRHLDVFAQ